MSVAPGLSSMEVPHPASDSHLSDRMLMALITTVMPVAFPLTELLYRLPLMGRLFRFVIPVANYVENPQMNLRQRYRWALMDTFDMLAPAYDKPLTQAEVEAVLARAGISARRLNNPGLNIVGEKLPIAQVKEA